MTDTTPASPILTRAEMVADATLFTDAGIAPEDQHYADAILALDPMTVRNTNHEFPSSLRLSPMKATALPPGPARAAVEAQLQALAPEDREAREPALVAHAIRGMLPDIRTSTGMGEGVPEFYREGAQISSEHRYLSQRLAAIDAELEEVSHYRVNSETGEPLPVLRYQGDARTAKTSERTEIARKMRVLINPETGKAGVEGRRRLGEALRESVANAKRLAEQVAEAAEVKQMAHDMARTKRITAQAAALARLQETSL